MQQNPLLLNPNIVAAKKAVVEAWKTPDIVVRVTFTRADQVEETIAWVMSLIDITWGHRGRLVNEGKFPGVELPNNSLIEFAVDENFGAFLPLSITT